MKINRYSRGSVSIVVLLACVVLSGAVQALYYSLREEIEAESKIVLHNQLQAAIPVYSPAPGWYGRR